MMQGHGAPRDRTSGRDTRPTKGERILITTMLHRQAGALLGTIQSGGALKSLPQTTGSQEGHVPGNADAIAEIAKPHGTAERRRAGLQPDHPGQGAAQRTIEAFRLIGIAGDQGLPMP